MTGTVWVSSDEDEVRQQAIEGNIGVYRGYTVKLLSPFEEVMSLICLDSDLPDGRRQRYLVHVGPEGLKQLSEMLMRLYMEIPQGDIRGREGS